MKVDIILIGCMMLIAGAFVEFLMALSYGIATSALIYGGSTILIIAFTIYHIITLRRHEEMGID